MPHTPILHALSVALGAPDIAPDAELLRRFAEAGDRTAFELVVRRHAELVWNVCRTVLHDPHAAEDAFQAAFLALARKAASVRDGSAAGWLFRVAHNAAVRARGRAGRRAAEPLPEGLVANSSPADEEAARREAAPVVVEEVDRLAAKFRAPVVLCFFEGHTHAEAAEKLGWPVGTVASRLARAKDVLRARLTRRGVVLPAAGLGAVFAPTSAPAAVALDSALALATGPADRVPPSVLSLTQGVLSTMRFAQFKPVAALVAVAVGLTAALAAVPLGGAAPDAMPAPRLPVPVAKRPAPPPPKEKTAKEQEAEELKKLQGNWRAVKGLGKETLKLGDKPTEDINKTVHTRAVITKDNFRITSDRGDESYKITLAPREKPSRIDLTVQNARIKDDNGKVMRGIYELEGDSLKMCLLPFAYGPEDLPKEFKSSDIVNLVVFERVFDEKKELEALAGEWKPVKATGPAGEEVPADELAKERFVIKGAVVTITGPGEEGKVKLKVDPAAVPPSIDFVVTVTVGADEKEVVMKGIYFRQGDKLTTVFRDVKAEKDDRPTELKPGADVVFSVLERVPKK